MSRKVTPAAFSPPSDVAAAKPVIAMPQSMSRGPPVGSPVPRPRPDVYPRPFFDGVATSPGLSPSSGPRGPPPGFSVGHGPLPGPSYFRSPTHSVRPAVAQPSPAATVSVPVSSTSLVRSTPSSSPTPEIVARIEDTRVTAVAAAGSPSQLSSSPRPNGPLARNSPGRPRPPSGPPPQSAVRADMPLLAPASPSHVRPSRGPHVNPDGSPASTPPRAVATPVKPASNALGGMLRMWKEKAAEQIVASNEAEGCVSSAAPVTQPPLDR